ncbi:heterokaryon incompatibility protein, partial [Colletotrichum asianum]
MQLWWHLDDRYEKFETMTASINLRRTYPSSTLATKYQWSNIGNFLIHPYSDGELRTPRPLAEITSSKDALLQAKKWCDECVQGHTRCRASANATWYPTRLVDFGSRETSCSHFRLVQPSKEHLTGPYMTLSHCWGQADCLKLTTDNLTELSSWLP